jgi:pyruvate formate lyase activating enzyme
MSLAMFFDKGVNSSVSCSLCPHNCKIPAGSRGLCGIRQNIDGQLWAIGYGLVSSLALDPIEKKPLFLFHPGKQVLSAGGYGCNLRCPFCQNSDISLEYQKSLTSARYFSPEQITGFAQDTAAKGNIGVAYTYNEPLTGYEFIYDCAKLVQKAGLFNILVTNGYISPEPLKMLLPYIDAMNIDLKGFTDSFYQKLGGSLEPVKETIELSYRQCHLEITTLIIPGENDSETEIESLACWLASLDPKIPLHLTRFFPRYKYADRPPASRESVYRLCEIAQKHLGNVFTGNMG